MPQYAGLPGDTSNEKTDPCGCKYVRMALPGNPWVRTDRCERHGPKVTRTNLFLGIWGTGILCYPSQFQPGGAQLLLWFVVVLAMMCASFSARAIPDLSLGNTRIQPRSFRRIDRRSHR